MESPVKESVIAELANAIAAVARGDDDIAREIVGALAHLMASNTQAELPGIGAAPPAMTAEMVRRSAVGRLFAYWQDRCDHKQAKLTPDRTRCIIARLKEGYSETEIRKAIDGASIAAFVNDDGHKYDDLTLICRNGSKLEDFIARGVKATGAIVVELTASSSVEEQIADLRVKMSVLRKDGRDTEYQHAAGELQKLMAKRERKASAT